jgi:hypothetical protein
VGTGSCEIAASDAAKSVTGTLANIDGGYNVMG